MPANLLIPFAVVKIAGYSRLLFFLVGFCFLTQLRAAEPPEARNNFPYAVLSADSIHLGRLLPGSQGQGSLSITNGGRHDLIISRVRSSCGLLITTWPTEPLKPGERGSITFRYDTARPGPFERNIVVHTNAWQKNLLVPVTGEVISAERKASD